MANKRKSRPEPAGPVRDLHGIDPDEATRELDADPSMQGLMAELSRAFGGATDAGWGEINDTGAALLKQRASQAAAVKREANIFRDTFSTPAGRKCLAIMREMTTETAAYPSEAMLPMDAITPLLIAHDAQCRFVRSIIAAIAVAENQQPQQGQ